MRRPRHGLSGAPAAIVMGAALAAGVLAAWSATHVVTSLLEMSAGASLALTAIAVALTVVSFPVWFSLAMLYSASISARWRRPRVRRALSKMADELGVRAGTIVAEHWSGDGVITGPFSLTILVMLPGAPGEVVNGLAHRALEAGYGEKGRPLR
jgi:hypothetical protein